MIRMFAAAGLAVGFLSTTLPANAEIAPPDTYAQKACPAGTVWDKNRKKCVRVPRGSYGN